MTNSSSATPKPSPRPKPGPRPGGPAAAATPQPLPHVPATAEMKKFGKVTEDGAVYLLVGDSERKIGEWKAGDGDAALTHYAHRYQDVVTEVELLEKRIAHNPAEGKAAHKTAQELKAQLPTMAIIGDIQALEQRIDTLIKDADEASHQAVELKEKRRKEDTEKKTKLAEEAEQIGDHSTEWKEAGDRLRAILDEWKTIRGVDRATDDKLWKRFSTARDNFNRRRGAHFADLDRQRAQAKEIKEELCVKAESMADSTEWNDTAKAFAQLMKEWKAAGRAPRDTDDKLWKRFRAAQDTFFARRNEASEAQDREYEANAEAKTALLAEFKPKINPEQDLEAAKQNLHQLQERWEEIGFVPRGRVKEFEAQIHDLERSVNEVDKAQWRRTDPAVQARVAQFEQKVEELEAQAEAAEKAGKDKKAKEHRAAAEKWREWAEAARQAAEDR